VKVNADVSASGPTDNHQYDHQFGIDMSNLSINVYDQDGIINVNPEIINQTINGGGAGANVLFNLDQVNNLVDNDKAWSITQSGTVSVSDVEGKGGDISIGGSDGNDGRHDGGPHISFNGHEDGGGSSSPSVQIGSGNGDGSTNSTVVDSSGNVSIDALTQSIVLGANIQTNNFNMNNAGHDITVVDHGSSHDGNHNG
jgi:hypothetical protein